MFLFSTIILGLGWISLTVTSIPTKCKIKCHVCSDEERLCTNAQVTHPNTSHCSCCQCPRRVNEICSHYNPCNSNLHCYGYNRFKTGICKRYTNKLCIFNGVMHRDRTQFSISCRHKCQCLNGVVSCQDICLDIEQSSPPPLSICPNGAELILPRRNQCCREWACKNDFVNMRFNKYLTMIKRSQMQGQCSTSHRKMTTNWTKCSQSCGMGISTRISNENQMCINVTEIRYCFHRLCSIDKDKDSSVTESFELPGSRKPNCQASNRPGRPIHIDLQVYNPPLSLLVNNHQFDKINERSSSISCRSRRRFRPRFCSTCNKLLCCSPTKSKSKRIEFLCSDGIKRIEMFQWIQKCDCSPKC